MIKSAVARTPILVFILMFFALGYTIAHNKVVVVPIGADAGVSGYEVVSANLSLNNVGASSTRQGVVNCPTGKKVMGGGAASSSSILVIKDSFPANVNTSWAVTIRNSGPFAVSATLITYAICANTI